MSEQSVSAADLRVERLGALAERRMAEIVSMDRQIDSLVSERDAARAGWVSLRRGIERIAEAAATGQTGGPTYIADELRALLADAQVSS